jgi:hypothetical protein
MAWATAALRSSFGASKFVFRCLAGNRLYGTENILGAVTGFMHQQLDPLLVSSPIRRILGC